jgi:hypothetical protein
VARRRPHRAHHRPAGHNRSPVDDPDRDSTPELLADDLSRLLTHLDAGPAALLGSSAAPSAPWPSPRPIPSWSTPPPLVELLDDRAQLRAGTEGIIATRLAGDITGAWAKFLAQANITLPEGMVEEMWGGERDPQQVADERFVFEHELRATTRWQPDVAALREGPTRTVVGIGEESAGELCDRSSTALAAALGIGPAMFPAATPASSRTPTGSPPGCARSCARADERADRRR